jgi:hypothetical protein
MYTITRNVNGKITEFHFAIRYMAMAAFEAEGLRLNNRESGEWSLSIAKDDEFIRSSALVRKENSIIAPADFTKPIQLSGEFAQFD